MTNLVLFDNDIFLKTCCFGLVDKVLLLLASRELHPSILGVASFVVPKSVRKNKKIRNKESTAIQIEKFLNKLELIEPNEEEIILAIKFEELARDLNLALDIGESQLLAILIYRGAALLATGDKRAIKSIPPIVERCDQISGLSEKFICLEQIMYALLFEHSPVELHSHVCSEQDLDTSMGICFRCASREFSGEEISQSLLSYINNLRQSASSLLIDETKF